MDTHPLITVAEASSLTGRTHKAIQTWLSKGKVKGWRDSKGAWLIPRDAVLRHHKSIRRAPGMREEPAPVTAQQQPLIQPTATIDTTTIEHVAQITVSLAVLRLQCTDVRHELVRHLAADLQWLLDKATP